MVGTVAYNNKNPRVKQFILEKMDATIKQEDIKKEERLALFKAIKDKTLNFVQKETNASVRDAAVSLLTTFKVLLPGDTAVSEAINTLPKYRVTEINKKASDSAI